MQISHSINNLSSGYHSEQGGLILLVYGNGEFLKDIIEHAWKSYFLCGIQPYINPQFEMDFQES